MARRSTTLKFLRPVKAVFERVLGWLIVGALAHAWGMYDKHRIERDSGAGNPWWSALFYWLCWVLLGVGALAFVGRVVGLV